MLYYYVMLLFMVVFPLFWLRAAKDYPWKKIYAEMLPKWKSLKKELFGAAKLTALLFIAFIGLSLVLTLAGLNDLNNVNDVINTELSGNILAFAVTLCVVVFIEEYFFRAFLQKRIGIFPSTFIFGLLHFGYGSISEIIGAFALGLILAYWFKKHNSLLQNYLGHWAYNVIAILLYLIG